MNSSPRLALFASLLALLPLPALAQSTGTISGLVRESGTRAPLAGATAVVRDPADSTFKVLGDVSNAAGAFAIERVPLGRRLVLEVRYVGYESQTVDTVLLRPGSATLDVGEFLMVQRTSTSRVQITTERPQVTVMADKTVYGVEDNPVYTATNVSELLGQIPSVEVDNDGKVSLRGNDNVTIMMNGRPITMPVEQRNKFLQSLPVGTVKSIEVRTSPGAQFSAEYEGGVINIVTRRTMSDLVGGNVNAAGDSRLGNNIGAGLYYNGETLNASVGGGLYNEPGKGASTSLRLNYADPVQRRDVGDGTSDYDNRALNGYGQIDYSITPTDLASLSFNLNNWKSNYTSRSSHIFSNASGDVVGRFFDSSDPTGSSSNSGNYNNASFLFRHTFSGEHRISLDVSYSGDAHKSGNRYGTAYYAAGGEFDSIRSSMRISNSARSGSSLITSLDYENPISDTLTLSFGARNERNALDNSTDVDILDRATGGFVPDTLQTNHYLSENTIYALYGNVAWRPVADLGVQFGIRVERANVAADYASGTPIVSRNYTNIFPSGSLTLTLGEGENLTGSYRRSVALPDIDALNPTRVRWGDFYEFSGNADLEPEFTHQFQLAYSTFWGMGNMITFSPYYSTTSGSIEQSTQLVNGVNYSRSENFNGGWSLGAEASIGLRPLAWLNLRLSGDVYRKVNRGGPTPGDFYSTGVGYSGNGSISADLTEDLTLSSNLFTRTPASVGGSQPSGYTFLSFALRQRLFERKLTLSLRVNDPFGMQGWSNVYDGPDFHTESDNTWSSRYVGLSATYTFGTTPRMEEHRQEKSETKGSSGGGGGAGGGGQ